MRSYVDIGAKQRKEGGGDSASLSYVDIGAVQRQEATVTNTLFFKIPRWFTIVFLTLLIGCSAPATDHIVLNNLTIVQVEPQSVHQLCGMGRACYNRSLNRIIVQKITSQNDFETFQALGEELWHAMGGHHD